MGRKKEQQKGKNDKRPRDDSTVGTENQGVGQDHGPVINHAPASPPPLPEFLFLDPRTWLSGEILRQGLQGLILGSQDDFFRACQSQTKEGKLAQQSAWNDFRKCAMFAFEQFSDVVDILRQLTQNYRTFIIPHLRTLQHFVHKYGTEYYQGERVLCSTETRETLVNRMIETKYHVSRTILDFRDLDKVTVLFGESGSGKTYAAIMDSCNRYDVIYLTAVDLRTKEYLWTPDHDVTYTANADSTQRDKDAIKTVVYSITNLNLSLAEDVHPLQSTRSLKGLAVIVDEIEMLPQFVRAVCRVADDIKEALAKQFCLAAKQVHLILVGTGADDVNYSIGSIPDRYREFRVPNFTKYKEYMEGNDAPHFCEYIESNPSTVALSMRQVVTNARMVACLTHAYKCVAQQVEKLQLNNSVASHIMITAISKFKTMTGLADVSLQEATTYCLQSYVVSVKSINNRSTLDPHYHKLIATYGILSDSAERVPTKTLLSRYDSGYDYFSIDKDGKAILLQPSVQTLVKNSDPVLRVLKLQPRYVISSVQIVFLRLAYGMLFSYQVGWSVFEQCIDDFLTFAVILNLNEHPLGKLVCSDKCRSVVHLDGEFRLNHRVPTGKQSIARLQQYMEQICKHLEDNNVVIIHNADKASYADTIVLLPGKVILLQCKHYPHAELSEEDIIEEMEKTKASHSMSHLIKTVSGRLISPTEFHRVIIVYGHPPASIPKTILKKNKELEPTEGTCHYIYIPKPAHSTEGASSRRGENGPPPPHPHPHGWVVCPTSDWAYIPFPLTDISEMESNKVRKYAYDSKQNIYEFTDV
eukprot:PhF_6_TR10849/c0_g1_i2/m.17547